MKTETIGAAGGVRCYILETEARAWNMMATSQRAKVEISEWINQN